MNIVQNLQPKRSLLFEKKVDFCPSFCDCPHCCKDCRDFQCRCIYLWWMWSSIVSGDLMFFRMQYFDFAQI